MGIVSQTVRKSTATIATHLKRISEPVEERITYHDANMMLMIKSGIHLPMQIIFRVDGPCDEQYLRLFNEHIAVSGIGRTAHKPVIPGAPYYWGRTAASPPVCVHHEEMTEEQAHQWINEQPLRLPDNFYDPGWLLSATNLQGNTSLISLSVSHHVGDAFGVTAEILKIMPAVTNSEPAPPRRYLQSAYENKNIVAKIASDLRSIPHIWSHSVPVFFMCYLPGLISNIVSKILHHQPIPPAPPAGMLVTKFVDAAACQAVAKENGGSLTTLFSGMTINVNQRLNPQSASLKYLRIVVNQRTDPRATSNQVSTAQVETQGLQMPVKDLAELKTRSKQAYELVGTRRAKKSFRPGNFISNVGHLPLEAGTLIPHTMYVYARALLYSSSLSTIEMTSGVYSFLTIFDDKVAWTVVNNHVKTTQDLSATVDAELEKWGIEQLSSEKVRTPRPPSTT